MTMLDDSLVCLREWTLDDGDWYAEMASTDPEIQRFTVESPTVTGDEVRAAIAALAGRDDAAGFLISDSASGERLGNIALAVRDGSGEVLLTLNAHVDNVGSRRVAERAGFQRDPGHDADKEVRGEIWPMVAYRRLAPR